MSEENKTQNKIGELINNVGNFDITGIAFVKDNPDLVYVYKKLKRLTSAVYLLSNFISDKEPVKWDLRTTGLELLSISLSLPIDASNFSSHQTTTRINPNIFIPVSLKFLSYLEIAYVAGLISKMNFEIIKYELEALIKIVDCEDKTEGRKGLSFSANFFDLPRETKEEIVPENEIKVPLAEINYSKGHKIMSDRLSVKKTMSSNHLGEKDKTNRQIVIVSMLKKNKELSIKDFTTSINGCSEKTIQRELATLVSKGQVQKTGDKRWSRYSLK